LPIPKKIDPKAQYRVTLTDVVMVGKTRLLPRPDLQHTIKGSVLEANLDKVSDAAKAD
jgi:hypothetical protein